MLLLLAAALALVLELGSVRPQLDDAYISYRYAANLVNGHGLVYNPGEYVEGITNLLWTLLIAGGLRLGFEANAAGHVLGVASAVAALTATWCYACAFLGPGRRWLAGLAPWIVLAATPFMIWTSSGMETPLYVALTIASLAAVAWNRPGLATGCVGFATLTRPDAVLTAAVIYGFHLLQHRREGWRSLRWPLAYAAILLALTGFRLAYYGSPVPNTFYAKVGGVPIERGFRQVWDFLALGLAPLLVPAAIAVGFERRTRVAAAVGLLIAPYVISVGGDIFPHFRFLLPLLPIVGALAVVGIDRGSRIHRLVGLAFGLSVVLGLGQLLFEVMPPVLLLASGASALAWGIGASDLRWRAHAAAGATGVLVVSLAVAFDLFAPTGTSFLRLPELARFRLLAEVWEKGSYFEKLGRNRAQKLLAQRPPVRLVATGAIGSLGYYSNLPILDIYGLVDPVIARSPVTSRDDLALIPGHQRSDADYVMSRKPDYILIPKRRRTQLQLPALVELWEHPDLDRRYVWDETLRGYRRLEPNRIGAGAARRRASLRATAGALGSPRFPASGGSGRRSDRQMGPRRG